TCLEMPMALACGQRSDCSQARNWSSILAAGAAATESRTSNAAEEAAITPCMIRPARTPMLFLRPIRSERRPRLECRRERTFIQIVQLAAYGNPVRQARHLHIEPRQLVSKVVRGGLPLDRCVHREDDLFHPTG